VEGIVLAKKTSSRKSVGALDRETLRQRVSTVANMPHAEQPGAGKIYESENSIFAPPPISPETNKPRQL